MENNKKEAPISEKEFYRMWKFTFQKQLKETYEINKQTAEMFGYSFIGYDEFCLRMFQLFPQIFENSIN